jgi:uncharacterized protein (DUF58 family)
VLPPAWLALTVVVLLASVLARDGLLFLVSLTALGAAGVSRLWGRYCLARVEYHRRLSQPRAAWGDEVDLELEVVNRKPLPLAWLEVQEELPAVLAPSRGTVRRSHRSGRSLLGAMLGLRWYERVRRRYRIVCLARGDHWFGPTTLRSGDLFGFETRELVVASETNLLVYPRVVPIGRLGLPAVDPLGERAARDWLFQDPLRTVGVREYVRGDSRRRIHWGATARTGALQVKVHEPTTEPRLIICLNVETLGEGWWRGYDPELLELAISTAASVAAWAVEQGRPVGLYANAALSRSAGAIARPPSRDPAQLTELLTLLARALPISTLPFAEFLARQRRAFPYGATLVVVTAEVTPSTADRLLALRAAGHRVVLLQVGDRADTARLPGIATRTVRALQALS